MGDALLLLLSYVAYPFVAAIVMLRSAAAADNPGPRPQPAPRR